MEIDDFVVTTTKIDEIVKWSVGWVRQVSGDKITVLFVGANLMVETDDKHVEYLDIKKTGKAYERKICNICYLLKDTNDFDVNQTDARGGKTTRPTCKKCRVDIDGTSLTPTERRRLKALTPKGVFSCSICGKVSIVGVTANFVIDHCHKTGRGREWICDSCNTGLGRFKDDPDLLQKAIDYLKKHT